MTAAESAATDAVAAAETVEAAGHQFEQVAEYVDETNDGITEISRATDDQAPSTEETVTIVKRAPETREQTTSRIDDVVAGSRTQVEPMDDLATDSENLTARARELQRPLEQFTTGDGERGESRTQAPSRSTPVPDGEGD